MNDDLKPRILFVGHSPELHGAEYSLLRLVKELRPDFQIGILAPAGGPFESAIRELGLSFYSLNPRYPFALLHDKKSALPAFVDQLARETTRLNNSLPKFDLVHSNTMYVWEGAALAAHWGVPHIWNLREVPQASPTWRPALGWTRTFELLGLLSDRIVGVSQALLQALPETLHQQTSVIHNGLDAQALWSREESRHFFSKLGIPDSAKVALTVGNFIPEKGHLECLDWLAECLVKFPDWHCLWVGELHFSYPAVQQKIQALVLQDRIHCPGAIALMGQKMRGADLLLLPSLTEAFPTVLLEARCAGVPFLASDCGGAREIAAQGGGECWQNHDDAKAKCEQAFRGDWKVPTPNPQAFSMVAMAKAYAKVYRNALTQRPSPSTLSYRQASLAGLLELNADLSHHIYLQNSVDRLKAFRGLGRFFRWWFKA
jgi:glycosyltransferase involved in cell wall biosynthesis